MQRQIAERGRDIAPDESEVFIEAELRDGGVFGDDGCPEGVKEGGEERGGEGEEEGGEGGGEVGLGGGGGGGVGGVVEAYGGVLVSVGFFFGFLGGVFWWWG